MAEDSHGEVWEAFRQLEAMEQEVVRLIVMEELSKREAAKQLARSLKDVTQLLTIALAKLEKVLTSDKEVLR
jgi:DNA-directed RNA polymerase specialized sigma24 family protein